MDFEAVVNIIAGSRLPQDFGHPAHPESIEQAEATLEVKLPTSYKKFLEHFGWGGIGADEYFGIGREVPKHLNLLTETKEARELFHPLLPTHLVPVANNGFGDSYCLDISQMDESGECPVVIWYHEDGPDQQPKIVAGSFAELVASNLQEEQDKG